MTVKLWISDKNSKDLIIKLIKNTVMAVKLLIYYIFCVYCDIKWMYFPL